MDRWHRNPVAIERRVGSFSRHRRRLLSLAGLPTVQAVGQVCSVAVVSSSVRSLVVGLRDRLEAVRDLERTYHHGLAQNIANIIR